MARRIETCVGVKETAQVTEYMAETAQALISGEDMSPERETAIRNFMSEHNVGFVGELDPRPNQVSYTCGVDCSHCKGKLLLDVRGSLSTVKLPAECPNYEETGINAVSYEDVLGELDNPSDK